MLTDDIIACAEIVRRGDPSRFQATMAAPVGARAVLFPIYAFNVEVARAPWVTQEPMIAEMRLQWWRDALQEIGAGGSPRRHDILTPLARVMNGSGLALLDEMIEARRRDIYREPFARVEELETYLDRTSGNLVVAAAAALGHADTGVLRDAGLALGLANWFRAVPALEANGWRPFPENSPEALRKLALEGLGRLSGARQSRAAVSTDAVPALLPVWEADKVLEQVAKDPVRVSEGRLGLSLARSRLILMLRALSGRW